MRAIRLAIAFLLILAWVAPASAQASASSAFSFRSDLAYRPSVDISKPASSSASASTVLTEMAKAREDQMRFTQRGANTCYMIRSYVFVREHVSEISVEVCGAARACGFTLRPSTHPSLSKRDVRLPENCRHPERA